MESRTVVIVSEPENHRATLSVPVAKALEVCFERLGWRVRPTTERISDQPDLVAGWGFQAVMHEAWDRWPERVLHVDAGFWSRETHNKLALGGRWSPLTGRDYDDRRFRHHAVTVALTRKPGSTILVCGMSAKAAGSWGMNPEEWERDAVSRLRSVGAREVIYRPKPTWPDARAIKGSTFDRSSGVDQTMRRVHGVVSHHSNAAIDALAAGLPIYVEIRISRPLSVPQLEDIVGATAPDQATRQRFLNEIAYHQWTLAELSSGKWLDHPAPLADNPILTSG